MHANRPWIAPRPVESLVRCPTLHVFAAQSGFLRQSPPGRVSHAAPVRGNQRANDGALSDCYRSGYPADSALRTVRDSADLIAERSKLRTSRAAFDESSTASFVFAKRPSRYGLRASRLLEIYDQNSSRLSIVKWTIGGRSESGDSGDRHSRWLPLGGANRGGRRRPEAKMTAGRLQRSFQAFDFADLSEVHAVLDLGGVDPEVGLPGLDDVVFQHGFLLE